MPKQKKRKRFLSLKHIDLRELLLAAFICLLFFIGYFVYDLPNIESVKPSKENPSIVILANDGAEIARYGGNKGEQVTIKELPQHLIEAVISVEDRRFYYHFGIDPIGIARAMFVNLRAGHLVQGGSTITQQLAKNIFLTPDRTLRRKVQEALMALQIEYKYSKNEILAAYLNRVYFGSGAYGVDAAAKIYFNKRARDLTLWESAVVAGLLKAPSKYAPTNNPELTKKRTAAVLAAMKDAGYIYEWQKDQELANMRSSLSVPRGMNVNNYYFADWVLSQVDSFIADAGSDIIIRTTLSARLQNMAIDAMRAMRKAIPPEDKVSQMALVTEAHDGAVLAMLGGVDYNNSQFNRATQAKRQMGSVFKPFVYLAALEEGYKPDTLIEDVPTSYNGYRPENYDGKYLGQVTMTQALQNSLNSATVGLLKQIGLRRLNDVVERAGLNAEINQDLSSALGSTEVPLINAASAYAVFANGGLEVQPYAVLSVEDATGEVLYERENESHARVFDNDDIEELTAMLSQVVVGEGTGKGAFYSGAQVLAGKTGTTQNYRDAWFIGYNEKMVTGIWMGNDNNQPTNRVTGGRYPASLWRNYMSAAQGISVADFSSGHWKRPSSGRSFDIFGMFKNFGKMDLNNIEQTIKDVGNNEERINE